jgi:hypothetical protein
MSLMLTSIPVSPLLASSKPVSILLSCIPHSNPGSFTSLTIFSALWHRWCELSRTIVKPFYYSLTPGNICKIMVGSCLYIGLGVLIFFLHKRTTEEASSRKGPYKPSFQKPFSTNRPNPTTEGLNIESLQCALQTILEAQDNLMPPNIPEEVVEQEKIQEEESSPNIFGHFSDSIFQANFETVHLIIPGVRQPTNLLPKTLQLRLQSNLNQLRLNREM